MIKKRFISMLVLLCLTVSGAWAQEETLLTTILSADNTSFTSGSKTFDNCATVTFSGEVHNQGDGWGWWSQVERTLTVTAAEGYTITRVKFYTVVNSAFDEEAPFEAILVSEDVNVYTIVNGTSIGQIGVTKIEVYGYGPYKVSLKGGTEDATSWQGKAGTGNYQVLPLEGLEAGTAVSVKYSGWKLVKSVKAKKKALNLTSPAVGQVIGDDGKNYNYASLPGGVTAVAKICYVSGSNGLALALTDEGQMNWSTAISTCAAHRPAFTGGTWKLATEDDWDNMITAAGDYTALRDGFSGITGASNLQSAGYWSSTEDDSDYARFCHFDNDDWYVDYKDRDYYWVRACLAFGAQGSDPDPIELTSTDGETWTLASMPEYDVELEVEYFNITVPTANTADIYAGFTTPLINAGSTTEEGATMKYLVTATNEQPTSTDGFSADVPTAQATAITGPGTYYVWYYLDFESGDDSNISALAVEVTVKAVPHYDVTLKEGTEDATSWQGKAGTGEYQALPLEGVALGTAVSVKYNGTKLVKSVNAKKKVTAEDKGKVIGTDGNLYADVAAATAAGTTAVAKIIYIGPTGHATYNHGLALALTDEGQMAWQAAIDACSAKNTSTPITGATWLLASFDQWGYMMGADGAGSSSALRGGSNLQSAGYWSGTESDSGYAWYYDFNYRNWGGATMASDNIWVRACLAFWALETVPLNHSANNTWAIAEMPGKDVELEVEYFNITVPTANTADIYAGTTTPLINAGSTTDGATMKYLVTATNEQPTSTDGFSADVPTAQAITGPGTYYVWYYLDFASGADSDISALAVEVTVKAYAITMKEGTLDATNWQGKAGESEYQALPLEGVAAGRAVTLQYTGTELVKSVKAKKNPIAENKGKLICTDGHIHAYGEDAECTKARVAKIIYIGPTGHDTYTHGLALALTDEPHTMFSYKWGEAMTACNNKNTSTPVTDATWLLASKDQWDYMLGANGAGSYTALRDGFSSVGGSNMESGLYWSSTKHEGYYDEAWCYVFEDGHWGYNQKKNYCRVRACLAFGAAQDPDPIELTSTDGETWTLASMPDYDVELDIEYYPAYPVTINAGDAETANWSATPTKQSAGQNVTLQYTGKKKIKRITIVPNTLAEATAEDCGKVVCAAGHLHPAKTAVPSGCTAVGILGKVTETGHGLILALWDAPFQSWETIHDNWTSVTTYAGTTLKLVDDGQYGPLTGYTTLGSTAVSNWCLAQKSDYEAIFTNLGSTSTSYDDNVNAYLTTGVGGAGMYGEYWCATAYDIFSGWEFLKNGWFFSRYSNGLRPVLGFAAAAPAPAPAIPVTDLDNNTWQFTMPDYAVVANIEYDTDLELREENTNTTVLAEWDGYEADVTLTRTLQAGSWNTFAAPFSTAIPSGWTVKQLTSATFADGTLTLNFATAASIEAGKPYLVKVTATTDLSTAPFTGAIVSKDAQPFTSTDVDFIPTLGATTIEGSDTKSVLFLAAGNKLLNPSALPANMKGFRAYFQLKGEAALAKSFNIDFGNGETTGIISIEHGTLNIDHSVYDLDGRRIVGKPSTKGVYIQNGKKVIK